MGHPGFIRNGGERSALLPIGPMEPVWGWGGSEFWVSPANIGGLEQPPDLEIILSELSGDGPDVFFSGQVGGSEKVEPHATRRTFLRGVGAYK